MGRRSALKVERDNLLYSLNKMCLPVFIRGLLFL